MRIAVRVTTTELQYEKVSTFKAQDVYYYINTRRYKKYYGKLYTQDSKTSIRRNFGKTETLVIRKNCMVPSESILSRFYCILFFNNN